MFGIFISDPAQINIEAQAIRLDSEVQKLTEQVKSFDPKISENLNTFVDYTKLPDYAPSEIEIVIPPNFDIKSLELEGNVTVETLDNSVAETTVSPSKTNPQNQDFNLTYPFQNHGYYTKPMFGRLEVVDWLVA